MRVAARLLSALAAVFSLSVSAVAHAADAPKTYTSEQIAQGKKDAPAVIATTGIPCTVVDAAFIGNSTPKGPDGKPAKGKQSVYEVACQGALGYAVLSDPAGGKATAYDCLTTATSPGGTLTCKLPENADPKRGLAPIVAAAGRTCTIADARAMGGTSSGQNYYELKCSQGIGFVIETAAAGSRAAPTAIDCAQLAGGNSACTLTSPAEIAAAETATITALVAKSGRACQVSGARSVGDLTNGQRAYEVACGPSGGFILMADKSGGVAETVDCARADPIAGGCKLTNSSAAKAAEGEVYARRAAASGFPCQVTRYRLIGTDTATKSDVVELACQNRPDGAIAMLPPNGGPGKFYDCVQAGALHQSCQLSDPSAVYTRYTQGLRAKGRTSCTVSNARWLGRYPSTNSELVETACSDGKPGYVMEVADGSDAIRSLKSCGQAKAEAGVTCSLPGNAK